MPPSSIHPGLQSGLRHRSSRAQHIFGPDGGRWAACLISGRCPRRMPH
jgi:hypothetical protein